MGIRSTNPSCNSSVPASSLHRKLVEIGCFYVIILGYFFGIRSFGKVKKTIFIVNHHVRNCAEQEADVFCKNNFLIVLLVIFLSGRNFLMPLKYISYVIV